MIAKYALPLLFTLVFLIGFFLMKNFALIAYSPLKYFGNPQNILEALMILLCISYVILYNFEDTKLIRGHIASVALIGVWTNLTGKSLSEALIFASTNPQYDDRLFIELQVQ